ncbi:alpha/beta fold hydrolase [Streptomyces sp. NPDC001276]|uniref:alpha/beta fold hydrolase n=1 Tax=Streptomyces sp. NPDC001276 TaxID=3364555 RepID=UPI003677AB28
MTPPSSDGASELSAQDTDFRTWWSGHRGNSDVPHQARQRLMVLTAGTGSSSYDALRLLTSWTDERTEDTNPAQDGTARAGCTRTPPPLVVLRKCENRRHMLAYGVWGSGPGLVLLPGIGGSAAAAGETLVTGLAAQHIVVLPDLPRSGGSLLPAGPLAVGTVAHQVVATAQNAGLQDFVITGTSLCAAIAVEAAARHPGLARSVHAAGFARPRTMLWLSLEMWASLHARRDGKLSAFLTSLFFSEDYLTALTPETLRLLTARLATYAPDTAPQIALGVDVRADLPAITAPTLVVAATGAGSPPGSIRGNSWTAYPERGRPRSRAGMRRRSRSRSGHWRSSPVPPRRPPDPRLGLLPDRV